MKAELYGVLGHAGWEWNYTLDFRIDRFYGFGQREAARSVLRFEPSFSIGQAEWLCSRMNRVCNRNKNMTLKEIRGELIKGLKELEVSKELLEQARMGKEFAASNGQGKPSLDEGKLAAVIGLMKGRSLLPEEMLRLFEASGLPGMETSWTSYAQAAKLRGDLRITSGLRLDIRRVLWRREKVWSCRRCGSRGDKLQPASCTECGIECFYCEACLTMGRISCSSVLIQGAERDAGVAGGMDAQLLKSQAAWNLTASGAVLREKAQAAAVAYAKDAVEEVAPSLENWGLSPAQMEASGRGIHFLAETFGGRLKGSRVPFFEGRSKPPRFLIWAVTGAGKTEMIFPLIEDELKRGGRVLLTTPRRDVVLELKPRLEKAFPNRSVAALYGGSSQRWDTGDITLATTHQLLRFHRSFDLVLIDEIDAFPYHNNPMLIYAAEQACSKAGRYILLSATPPLSLQKEALKGILPYVKVPVRFHRRPLPVPRRITISPPERIVTSGRLPARLVEALRRSVARRAQVFLFVPKISLVDPLVRLIAAAFPQLCVAGTSSKDDLRGEKVTGFREKQIDVLVTTTILERGVTVPRTDVIILGADSRLFDEASLVQMAGRAGRSKDDPLGLVTFASEAWTRSQAAAIRQIRGMNRLARQKGYLLSSGSGGEQA